MMDYTEDYTVVAGMMPVRDRLMQLAEECSELAQAALKVCRTLPSSMNPTPVSGVQAMEKMHEEFLDVLMCADLCGLTDPFTPLSMYNPKWARARKRMEDRFPQLDGMERELHDPDMQQLCDSVAAMSPGGVTE